MKTLLVEDERSISLTIARGLHEAGHVVDCCYLGEDAREQALSVDYDVVVLDWMLPDVDGLSVLRDWRQRGMGTPVLMLSARGSVKERVAGLRNGADDYLVKPFSFDELLARLEALARRSGGAVSEFGVGGVVLEPRRRVLRCGEREVSLTNREFALCSQLFAHPGDVLTRTELLSAVWGPNYDGRPNVRRKLERIDATELLLSTVRGVGYRLEPVATE